MTNADPHPSSSGRNQWDALVDVGAKLGEQLGPARLLAVIVLILIVGLIIGSAYTIHLLNQQGNESREKIVRAYQDASKTTQEMMSTATNTLTNTYKTLGEISDKQIENLKKMLELQSKLTAELEATKQDHDAQKKQLEEERKEFQVLQSEHQKLRSIHTPTVATLGALGSLVDEAPELLRAEATKPAVKQILQNSDQLLIEVTTPEAQYPRLKILLAFADLSGFVGDAAQQEKLARAALTLVARLHADGRARAGIAIDGALANVLLGNALQLQKRFPDAIKATQEGIRLYDDALGASPLARTAKLRERKAEAYIQLGHIVHLFRDNRDEAVRELRKALAAVLGQAKEEDIHDADGLQSLAWIHTNIANVELEQVDLEAAAREFQTARQRMQELGEAVHRRLEWRERLARIYNGSAQLLIEKATFLVREREAGRTVSPEQVSDGAQDLAQALDYLAKARSITTEELARDEDNLIWQSVHAWTLRNLGLMKLTRSMLVADGAALDESLVALGEAEKIGEWMVKAAQTNREWKVDLLWTQICRNEAMGTSARQDKNYGAMAQLFSKNVPLAAEALAMDPADDWRRQRARNRASYADALSLQNRHAEAREVYTEVNTMATEQADKAERDGSKRLWRQLADRAGTELARLP
jgi:hypothetical protein